MPHLISVTYNQITEFLRAARVLTSPFHPAMSLSILLMPILTRSEPRLQLENKFWRTDHRKNPNIALQIWKNRRQKSFHPLKIRISKKKITSVVRGSNLWDRLKIRITASFWTLTRSHSTTMCNNWTCKSARSLKNTHLRSFKRTLPALV